MTSLSYIWIKEKLFVTFYKNQFSHKKEQYNEYIYFFLSNSLYILRFNTGYPLDCLYPPVNILEQNIVVVRTKKIKGAAIEN